MFPQERADLAAVPSIGRAARVEGAPAPEADLTRALYEQYGNQLFRYCLHQLGSREEAEDAVQSTFLNAFRGIKRGVVPELESAWLFKIAHNVCLSRRRTSWRRGRIESPTDFDVVQELTPAPSRRADELIGLQDVLEQMPENQRRAILLREWQGLSYREIGEELELSQAAVETLIFRARRSLAAGLEEPPEAKRRLARGADLGNILAGLKSLLVGGGAAAKVAATVAVVSASTVVAAAPIQQSHARSHQPQAPVAPVPVSTPSSPAVGAVAGPATSFPRTAAKPGATLRRPLRLGLFAGLGAASTRVSAPDDSTVATPPAPSTPATPEPVSVGPAPAAPAAAEVQSQAPAPAQPAPQAAEPQHAPAAPAKTENNASAAPAASQAKESGSKGSDSSKGSGSAVTTPPVVAITPVQPSPGSSKGGDRAGRDAKRGDTKKTSAPIVALPPVTLSVQPATTATALLVTTSTATTTATATTPAAPVQTPPGTVPLPLPVAAPSPTSVPATFATAAAAPASVRAAPGRNKDKRDRGGNGTSGNDNH